MLIAANVRLFELIPLMLLLGGMVALFACSRVLSVILPRRADAIGMRSLGFFIPIAAASLISMLLGRPEIAVGIIFGTSVGAMTTVIGFVALAGPLGDGPAHWRRIWPFQLVASILVLISGFKGIFGWGDAVALLVEGLVLLTLWNDREQLPATPDSVLEGAWAGGSTAPPISYAAVESRPRSEGEIAMLVVQLLLVAVLLWFGGWGVTRGAVRTSSALRGLSTSGMAGSIVSLALVMPMMYGAWRQADGGRGWIPVTAQIGVVLLNLCALLPVLILLPYAAKVFPFIAYFAGDSLAPRGGLPTLLIFPSPMWRIDNVVLIVVGVLLLPVSIGKWRLGREEGMVLLAGYFFYLTTTLASGLGPGAH